MICKVCGSKMDQMLVSWLCPNNCHKQGQAKTAPVMVQNVTNQISSVATSYGFKVKSEYDLLDAVALCKEIESLVNVSPNPEDKWHVGLTGGVLYKQGVRKDIDLILYKHDAIDPVSREDANNLVEKVAGHLGTYWSVNHHYPGTKTVYKLGVNVDIFIFEVEDDS